MSTNELGFLLRGPKGLHLYKGVENPRLILHYEATPPDDVRVVEYSNNGAYLAFCDTKKTFLLDAETGEHLIEHDLPKPTYIKFSPKDTYFLTWEQYVIYGLRRTKDGQLRTPNPNLNFFSVKDRKYIKTVIARRTFDIPEWTSDEKFLIGISGRHIQVSDGGTLECLKTITTIVGVSMISVSPHIGVHVFAAYIPEEKNGTPARIELYNADVDKKLGNQITVAQCDNMKILWNSKGTAAIVSAAIDVDTSGQSYYGRMTLHVMDWNGQSNRVNLDKQGPVHDVKWSPAGNLFAVAYGIVPAKCALFNIRGQVHWSLGEGSYNEVYFNSQGSIFATCGFGSISSGKTTFWDIEKQIEINTIYISNTTAFSFGPDGKHFFTAITAPRMRVDNCYRLWDYQGKLLFEHNPTEKFDLWEVKWQPRLNAQPFTVKIPTLEEKKKAGLKILVSNGRTVAANAVKSSGAYVPPHLRGKNSSIGAMKPVGSVPVAEKSVAEKELLKQQKILKDIQLLKVRRDNNEKLEKLQLSKIDKEEQLLKDIAELKSKIEAEKL